MLSVSEVDVSYGFAKVLHNVSMEVQKGDFVFLVGRNGAGKTTLLKTICSLLKPDKGLITYNKQDITNLTTERLAYDGIRFVAQEKKVFTCLSVKENLELAASGAGVKLNDAVDMAVEVYPKFADLVNSKAGHLSGGQKEILLIVRALLGKPRLLLIDEPTEGLASIVIEDIFKLLKMLKGEMSAIIVEQNLSLVSKLADTVYFMREGLIVKEITSQELKNIENIEDIEAYL